MTVNNFGADAGHSLELRDGMGVANTTLDQARKGPDTCTSRGKECSDFGIARRPNNHGYGIDGLASSLIAKDQLIQLQNLLAKSQRERERLEIEVTRPLKDRLQELAK
ncbi:hypothetical protein R1flu_026580 [Riccia fluitans]|uniref:Uncharacterized protein n=1 Tax=Riccia fluitans TaxID=41844 RepID=A0ABD1XGC5_9MARC